MSRAWSTSPTMREAVRDLGGDPARINPLNPAEMVIDHSVSRRRVRPRGRLRAQRRVRVRPQQGALPVPQVGPAGLRQLQGRAAGHRHRAPGQHRAPGPRGLRQRRASPTPTPASAPTPTPPCRTAWASSAGASAASRPRRPCSASPSRCSSRAWSASSCTGELPDGTTATDLVLTITEMLREHGVVGKFVEFYGEGVGAVPLANRATIGNMSPEFGSTCAIFPIDDETVKYLELTGRPAEQVALVEAYAKEQGLWHDSDARGRTTPSTSSSTSPRSSRRSPVPSARRTASRSRRPRPPCATTCATTSTDDQRRGRGGCRSLPGLRLAAPPATSPSPTADGPHDPTPVSLDGAEFELDHGAVVIAAITSCTNTSNPSVMIGAALLAKKAVERGLERKPWVKTSLAPGSQGRHGLLRPRGPHAVPREAGLQPRRLRLHDLHRQLRPAAGGGQQGGQRRRPGRHVRAVRQPQLRGPDQPRRQDELPGLTAARGRVRARGLDGRRHRGRAARHGLRRPSGLPQGHLAVPAGGRGGRRVGDRPGDVHPRLRRRLRRRAALAGPAGAER